MLQEVSCLNGYHLEGSKVNQKALTMKPLRTRKVPMVYLTVQIQGPCERGRLQICEMGCCAVSYEEERGRDVGEGEAQPLGFYGALLVV